MIKFVLLALSQSVTFAGIKVLFFDHRLWRSHLLCHVFEDCLELQESESKKVVSDTSSILSYLDTGLKK